MALGNLARTIRFVGWESYEGRPDFDIGALGQALRGLSVADWLVSDSVLATTPE